MNPVISQRRRLGATPLAAATPHKVTAKVTLQSWRVYERSAWSERAVHPTMVCPSFGQGSSLLWTHTLKPLYSRPIALTQEVRSQVDDVCECMCE